MRCPTMGCVRKRVKNNEPMGAVDRQRNLRFEKYTPQQRWATNEFKF